MGFLGKSKSKDGTTKRKFGFGKRSSKKQQEAIKTTTKVAVTTTKTIATARQAPIPVTPEKTKQEPATPQTLPLEKREEEDNVSEELNADEEGTVDEFSQSTPVKKLLEDLNILKTSKAEGLEMIVGQEISKEAPKKPTYMPYNPDRLPPRGEEKDTPRAAQQEENDIVIDPAEDEPETQCDGPEDVTRKLLSVFNCADPDPCGALPEPLQNLVPDNACQPTHLDSHNEPPKKFQRKISYYNDQFASKFLDELLNVGYALVYHQQSGEDWVGRSVTMVLKPGVCNTVHISQPELEWSTMGGGQQRSIETFSIGLLDIHSISTSSVDDLQDEDALESPEDEEDLQCIFTITSRNGLVHVLEAITTDESNRLVTGTKNIAARLSKQLVAGDAHALSDFYDNGTNPKALRLAPEQAMVRLAHSFLDA